MGLCFASLKKLVVDSVGSHHWCPSSQYLNLETLPDRLALFSVAWDFEPLSFVSMPLS